MQEFNDLYVIQLELDLARVMKIGHQHLDTKSASK